MPKLRVHNLAISLDGYAAGPNQDVDNPLGVGWTPAGHRRAPGGRSRAGRQRRGDGHEAILRDRPEIGLAVIRTLAQRLRERA
jgi:hypothetical protein